MKTKLFFLSLFLLAAINLMAYDFKYGDLYYNITSDSTAEVTSGIEDRYTELSSINIPTTVIYEGNYYDVTGIHSYTFQHCKKLTSIIIPYGVTSIEYAAFINCSSLSSITIPYSITSIGESAFEGCSSLTSVRGSIAANSRRIFYGCSALESIAIGCTSIGESAFEGCSSLTEIDIPKSVTTIGDYAFAGCTGIKSFTLSRYVTQIGHGIVGGCSNLQTIVVDKGNPIYDSRGNCNAIIETATNTLVAGCINTTIPDIIDTIGEDAFYFCDNLQTIIIPKCVKKISRGAFAGCKNLSSVTIEDGVKEIEGDLTEFYELRRGAFQGCTKLSTISFPKSLTKIGAYAFANCIMLDSVIIPGHIKDWEPFVFANDYSLSSITISNELTYIPHGAFLQCALTAINLPNGITKIDNWAFGICPKLKTITIPQSVTFIGMYAFAECTALTSVVCYAIEPPATIVEDIDYGDTDPFYGVPTIPLYVPAESVEKYKQAECWKDFIVLPLSAKPADVDEPILNPSDNNVEIIWPQDPSATTYTIDISKGGELVCSLVFDANGVLQSIRFSAPSRSQESTTAQAQAANNGFSFVVEGLESGTTYHYTINATNSAGNILQTYSGTFKTTGIEMGIDDAGMNQTPTKFIRDGKVIIRQGNKHYTTTGTELE